MKDFPFKTLFLGIFMPPIFYVLTLQILENYLHERELTSLNNLILHDYEALYEGRYRVVDEIRRNLGNYLHGNWEYGFGVRTDILVKTKTGQILYPSTRGDGPKPLHQNGLSNNPGWTFDYMQVASDNYAILNEGLIVSSNLRIEHNSWISNSILVLYVFVSVVLITRAIRKGLTHAQKEEQAQRRLISQYSEKLARTENRLIDIEVKEQEYRKRIKGLNQEKKGLSDDIESLLTEMDQIESGLDRQKILKEEMELEVIELTEELEKLKKKIDKPGKKQKKNEKTHKRFSVLYKNLSFTDRSVEGFLSLTDEFQLKAEEVIHKLNEEGGAIDVRRKVFGRKGKMKILETDFSYSGRIYFQKESVSGIRIIAVGTKNTQEKDITYLENYR